MKNIARIVAQITATLPTTPPTIAPILIDEDLNCSSEVVLETSEEEDVDEDAGALDVEEPDNC